MQKVERQPRHFNTLKISRTLQEALPFASKPKMEKKRKQPLLETKRAVVMEPHERHVQTLVNQLNTIRNEKVSFSTLVSLFSKLTLRRDRTQFEYVLKNHRQSLVESQEPRIG